jgi:hypothetical protein
MRRPDRSASLALLLQDVRHEAACNTNESLEEAMDRRR